MAATEWWKYPDDLTLSEPDGWVSMGQNRYRAIRRHFLIRQTKGSHSKVGPIILERKLPVGAEIKFEKKQSIVVKNHRTISKTIQKTITTKLLSEVSSKLATEISLFSPVGKLQGEVHSRLSAEYTDVISAGLLETRSYEVTSTEELTSSFSLKVPEGETKAKNTYYFYLPVWPWQWDIYLYREEIVEFEYKRSKLFWRAREGVNSEINDLRLPLVRVLFYEPDDSPSIDPEVFEPEVLDANLVTIMSLQDPCPIDIKPSSGLLADFLPIAFPVTKKEKLLVARTRRAASKNGNQKTASLVSEEWTPSSKSRKRTAKKTRKGTVKRTRQSKDNLHKSKRSPSKRVSQSGLDGAKAVSKKNSLGGSTPQTKGRRKH